MHNIQFDMPFRIGIEGTYSFFINLFLTFAALNFKAYIAVTEDKSSEKLNDMDMTEGLSEEEIQFQHYQSLFNNPEANFQY